MRNHALKSDLKPLEEGENVVMRHENKWKHGTVEHETPRSYVVQTPDGWKYRRNQKHIRPTELVPTYVEPEEIMIQPPYTQGQSASNGNTHGTNDTTKLFEIQSSEQQHDHDLAFITLFYFMIILGQLWKLRFLHGENFENNGLFSTVAAW